MMTHQQREKALDEARTRDIVSVARQLGMDMKHIGKNYLWVEHDSFVLNTKKKYVLLEFETGRWRCNKVSSVNEKVFVQRRSYFPKSRKFARIY